MPDVFIATDKEKTEGVVMHKRTPVESPVVEKPDPIPPPVSKPKEEDVLVVKKEGAPSIKEIVEEKPAENVEIVKEMQREVPLTQTERKVTIASDATSEILVDDAERRNAVPLFTSFWQNPQGVYFDTQEANEHILLFLRRHFITNVPWIFMTILFLFLPFIVNYLVTATNFSLAIFPKPFVSASIFMYYLLVITAGFLRFLDWYFNISLITARRVMDIELKDLVYKKISATKISLVQDVNYKQAGTIRTIFNYGDILVQTAGATDNFFVNAVPRPEVVVQVMEALIGKGTEEKENAPL